MKELHKANLAAAIDHAALHSEVGTKEIERACREAIDHGFWSLAVNPVWVKDAAKFLSGSPVKVLSVAGFPLSANRPDIKVTEAVKSVSDGASEIDMVANVGWLASNRFAEAEREIGDVRKALPHNVILKVIIEAGKLTQLQQVDATKAVINGGAQFVKTCTGFFGGATVDQVRTLHETAGGQIAVKASGGIRNLSQCRALLEAGATRLGSSASVSIMAEFAEELERRS